MKKPVLQDEAFLDDVRLASSEPDRLHLWWLGQSGFLVQWQGAHLLIDPYLSDSLTKKYAETEKPHERLTERVIAPQRLDFIDVVTSSHNHTDHLDADTLIPLLQVNPNLKVIVPKANLDFAARRMQVSEERLTGIRADSKPLAIGPFTFYAIPSAHESFETDENGDHRYLGYVIQVGGRAIYHSGDCCLYAGLVERLRKWEIDLALLPVNGRDPRRGVPGNFTAEEAANLGKAVSAGLVIPCHYDMFAFNTVSPDQFAQAAESIQQPYRLLQNGERISL